MNTNFVLKLNNTPIIGIPKNTIELTEKNKNLIESYISRLFVDSEKHFLWDDLNDEEFEKLIKTYNNSAYQYSSKNYTIYIMTDDYKHYVGEFFNCLVDSNKIGSDLIRYINSYNICEFNTEKFAKIYKQIFILSDICNTCEDQILENLLGSIEHLICQKNYMKAASYMHILVSFINLITSPLEGSFSEGAVNGEYCLRGYNFLKY